MLIVARVEETRELLARWCATLGLEALLARNATAGLAAWSAARPAACVIADTGSKSSARGLARKIRLSEARVPGSRPCVLFAAMGYVDEAAYEAWRAAGFDSVLTLPMQWAAFKTRLTASGLVDESASFAAMANRAEAEALFASELADDMERLRLAIDQGAMGEISRWAHRIKGASLMFGRPLIGDLAALIEGETTGHPPEDPAELQRLLRALQALHQDSLGGLTPSLS